MLERIFTNDLISEFQSMWNQKFSNDPVVLCKLYIPWKTRTLCVFNYDPSTNEFCWLCFDGYEENHSTYGAVYHTRFREFTLNRLQLRAEQLWVTIVRDTQFKPCKVSELHLGL